MVITPMSMKFSLVAGKEFEWVLGKEELCNSGISFIEAHPFLVVRCSFMNLSHFMVVDSHEQYSEIEILKKR